MHICMCMYTYAYTLHNQYTPSQKQPGTSQLTLANLKVLMNMLPATPHMHGYEHVYESTHTHIY